MSGGSSRGRSIPGFLISQEQILESKVNKALDSYINITLHEIPIHYMLRNIKHYKNW